MVAATLQWSDCVKAVILGFVFGRRWQSTSSVVSANHGSQTWLGLGTDGGLG